MRSTIAQTFLVAAALVAATGGARAAEEGSVQRGLEIARTQCAECHLLGKEKGLSSNLNAPTFAAIANTPGMTAAALRVALNTPHESMPNLVIKGETATSLVAYILSLRDGQ